MTSCRCASAVVVPADAPSKNTVTVLFASAVPVTVGVVSLVLLPFAGVSTTGAGGGVVSTVKVLILESTLVLPSASAAVALTVCDPSINDGIAVNVQLPAPSAVVMPADAPSKNTVTVLPASAVPVTVGVLSLVLLPFAGVSTTGAAGAVLSTV